MRSLLCVPLLLSITFPLYFAQSNECYNTDCDVSPESLSKEFEADVPRTCINTVTGIRCFYSYIPVCASKASPLVYDIHGFYSCPLHHSNWSGWKHLADEECMVVVWPMGNVRKDLTWTSCWGIPGGKSGQEPSPESETIGCCCFKPDVITQSLPPPPVPDFFDVPLPQTLPTPFQVGPSELQDLEFLRTIASHVVRDVPLLSNGRATIDTKRIYMAGHSNGCMAGMAMAMTNSDLVAAVCCHAGASITPPADNYSPRPIWLVHGTSDPVIPYGGINLPGKGLFFPSAVAGYESLSKLNGCRNSTETEFDEGYINTSTNCTDGADVELVTIRGDDHRPYSDLATGGTVKKFNSTVAAWEFCSRYESLEEPELDLIEKESGLFTEFTQTLVEMLEEIIG